MQTVKLIIFDVELAFRHKKILFESLKDFQKEKVLRYKRDIDQARSLASSYLVNQLSNEPLLFNEMGKPYYENGPHFNVSHSGKYIVMVVSNTDIGVDIEENVEKNVAPLIRLFNEVETKMIREHADFYYLWCSKESLIKCLGASVSKVRDIPGLPLNGVKTYKGKDYRCKTSIYDKHIISITRNGSEEFEVKLEKVNQIPFKVI